MFHVVYSRHYWDTEDQGTFANTWTLYRNVEYSQIGFLSGKCAELKEQADKTYAEYESKQEHKSDPEQFHMSEVYVVDDKNSIVGAMAATNPASAQMFIDKVNVPINLNYQAQAITAS